MDFGLDEEQRAIVDTVRAFVSKELYPHEDEVERLGDVPPSWPTQIRGKALDAGLYAANMPAELGGGGLDALAWRSLERELGRASYALQWLVARPEQHPAGVRGRAARAVPAAGDPRRAASTAWR